MASPKLSALPDTGADGETQSPPTVADMNRVVAAVMQAMYPTIRNLRVVGELVMTDGRTEVCRLPVPTNGPGADLKAAVLEVLGRLKTGEYMKGRNVAWEIDEDLDHKSGTFTRAIRELRDCDPPKIESHQVFGYRIATRD